MDVLQVLINGIFQGSQYALLAVGLTLIFGVMHIINFAHGDLMILASYLCYWLFTSLGIDPFLSVPITTPILFVLGYMIQKYLLRFVMEEPIITLLMTYGLALLSMSLIFAVSGGYMRAVVTDYSTKGLELGDLIINYQDLGITVVSVVVILLFFVFLSKTWFGMTIRACAQNKKAARLVGIHYENVTYLVFGLGTAISAVAGTLIVSVKAVNPTVGGLFTLKAFTIVVLGSMGNILGCLFGGLILGVMEALVSLKLPAYQQMVSFIVLLIILVLRPQGLFGKKAAN